MQQIKVTRVETKPMDRGGKMVAIFDEKGTRFSGFDASLLEIQEGDIINADIKVSGIYNDIHSFEFVKKAPRSGTDAHSAPVADEQRADARAVFTGAMTLTGHLDNTTPGDKMHQLLEAAFDWGLAVFKPAASPQPQPKVQPPAAAGVAEPGKDQKPEDLSALEFANPGEFYTACLKRFGLAKSKVDVEIAGLDVKDPTQRKRAWLQLAAAYGKKAQ